MKKHEKRIEIPSAGQVKVMDVGRMNDHQKVQFLLSRYLDHEQALVDLKRALTENVEAFALVLALAELDGVDVERLTARAAEISAANMRAIFARKQDDSPVIRVVRALQTARQRALDEAQAPPPETPPADEHESATPVDEERAPVELAEERDTPPSGGPGLVVLPGGS